MPRLLKITMMGRRREGITDQQLYDHITKFHAPETAKLHVRHGVTKYVQYFTPESIRKEVGDAAAKKGRPWQISDYDFHVEYYVHKLEDLENVGRDPEYSEKLAKEEGKFVEASSLVVTAGWEEIFVEDGKIVRN